MIIGEYQGDKIIREYYGQGMIYKNDEAFENKPEEVCYIPELSDEKYTRNDFLELCTGDEELARTLFNYCDWQHPETVIDEWIEEEEWEKCDKCGKIYDYYTYHGRCPYCQYSAESILSEIIFKYELSTEQSELFSFGHRKYDCSMEYKNTKISFHYQCNPEYKIPNIKDCLWVLLMDMQSFNSATNVDDFLEKFGYVNNLEEVRKGEKAYNGCERIFIQLHEIFTEGELKLLNEYFSGY